ncbi:hypothetical protein GCM10028791_40860 [Echinicola sediminis]
MALYGPFILFYIVYHSNPDPVILLKDEVWGYVLGVRKGSLDLIQRYWIFCFVLWGLIMLFQYARNKENEYQKRRQAFWIGIGILIPTVQGAVTQMLFHSFGLNDVPVTSTFMTGFTLFTWVCLRKYKLFDFMSLIEIEKVFHTLPSFVLIVSADLKIIYANLYAQKVLFESGEEAIGKDFRSVVCEEGQEFLPGFIFDPSICAKNAKDFETVFVGEDGQKINVAVTAVGAGRKYQGEVWVLMANDISQQVKAEKAVELARERYDLVSKAANEAFWERNLVEKSLRWGGNYCRLFGYESDKDHQCLEEWEALIHPEDLDRVRESMSTYVHGGNINKWEEEFRFRKKDGEYAHVLNTGYLLKDKNGRAVRMVGCMQDVSKLRGIIEQIKSHNQEFSRIAFAQSHLVRAPLARIMGLVIHMREFGFDPDEQEMLLDSLMKSCEELDSQLREIARKTSNIRQLELKSSSVRDIRS